MKKVFTQSFLGILLAALPCIVHAQTTASTLLPAPVGTNHTAGPNNV